MFAPLMVAIAIIITIVVLLRVEKQTRIREWRRMKGSASMRRMLGPDYGEPLRWLHPDNHGPKLSDF